MALLTTCCGGSTWKRLSLSAAKAAGAKLRSLGTLPVAHDWSARAKICERCPMRFVRRGVSYCGRPLLEQPVRDVAVDGCGCPTVAKAKAPGEHCPLDASHRPVDLQADRCSCKWCAAHPPASPALPTASSSRSMS